MMFICELPKDVEKLIYSMAELHYKELYPEMDYAWIQDKLSDFVNYKIKDVVPLLQEYVDELYERSTK